MVRALLDGRKTQTRRLLDPQPELTETGYWHVSGNGGGCFCDRESDVGPLAVDYMRFAVGDRLWVKETWRAHRSWDETKPREILACSRVWFEADRDNCDQHGKVRVSIFMPRWASRLTLIVTEVRVERLNECSEADAIAEGVQSHRMLPDLNCTDRSYSVEGASGFPSAVDAYRWLWDSINGPGAWEANPWVVAVSFAVVRRNIDQC